jgi:hypothetical protein
MSMGGSGAIAGVAISICPRSMLMSGMTATDGGHGDTSTRGAIVTRGCGFASCAAASIGITTGR